MKNYSFLAILAGCTLAGCTISDHSTNAVRHKEVIVGTDTDFEVTADSLTRGEIAAGEGGVTIIMNPKGTKVLKTVYHDPLAGIISATGVHVVVGRNQSLSFGKLMGAVNNYILGWVTNNATNATRDVNLAKEQTIRNAENGYTTRYVEGIKPTVTDLEHTVVPNAFAPTR